MPLSCFRWYALDHHDGPPSKMWSRWVPPQSSWSCACTSCVEWLESRREGDWMLHILQALARKGWGAYWWKLYQEVRPLNLNKILWSMWGNIFQEASWWIFFMFFYRKNFWNTGYNRDFVEGDASPWSKSCLQSALLRFNMIILYAMSVALRMRFDFVGFV